MNRTYSRQAIAAWLHGSSTGHANGWHDGRTAGHAEGYDAGHASGVEAGYLRCWAEQDALWARIRTNTRQTLARPSQADLRARRSRTPAKPLQTPAECLATWSAPPTLPTVLHAVRHAP